MKKLMMFIVLLLLSGCSHTQNSRTAYVVSEIGNEVKCPAPPADIVKTFDNADGKLSLKLDEVEKIILDSGLTHETKYQKIREIDPQLQTIETIHYRLCIEYTNGIYTKEEYKEKINSLPLYKTIPDEKPFTSGNNEKSQLTYPVKSVIAPAGTWHFGELELTVKVKWIGGGCIAPCEPVIKAGLEITTSSYQMPNYPAVEGFSTAFTHKNSTYKLTLEEIRSKPSYIVVSVEEIKT